MKRNGNLAGIHAGRGEMYETLPIPVMVTGTGSCKRPNYACVASDLSSSVQLLGITPLKLFLLFLSCFNV